MSSTTKQVAQSTDVVADENRNAARSTDVGREKLWGKRELAEFLGISIGTVHKWTSKRGGGPPHVRVGDLVRFIPSDVLQFLETRKKQ